MSTTDQEFPNNAMPTSAAQQEPENTPPEDTKSYLELQSQILHVLKELRQDQRGLRHDIPRIARELWESDVDAWALEPHTSWTGRPLGKIFLESLVPDSTNLQAAKRIFDDWVRDAMRTNLASSYDFPVNPNLTLDQIINNAYQWPNRWDIFEPWSHWDFDPSENGVCCRNTVICATPSNFKNLFSFEWVSNGVSGSAQDLLGMLRSDKNSCGIIVQFSISRRSDVIDLRNAAAIICLVQGNIYSANGLQFLDGHINAEWREQPENDRCGITTLSLPDNATLPSFVRGNSIMAGIFMHHMRSFIVVNPNKRAIHTRSRAPGLKCFREHITFQGFYDGTMTKLIEKRYSTALRLLPLQKPAGHYALVSICDGQQKDVKTMFEESPGGDAPRQHTIWKKYGIHPAGLYTGISMFQLQICVLIDSWEQDWTSTIKQIDEMVSLKFHVLENDKLLRRLVFGNSSDASVSYFKVLQILNNFSDIVRAAPSYLDTLSNSNRDRELLEYYSFHELYPYAKNTEIVIRHNWKIVRERQRDASDRILAKLERTSNEVKSLQSGLFNVQSITEARKSRVLNKYLTVFTIVTILFLPPTFVATFFGMHIFDADTIDTTQKIFWVVLAALSGGTYLFAALGLFGSNFSAEEREEWKTSFRGNISALHGNLAEWYEDTKQYTKEKMRQVGLWFYAIFRRGKSHALTTPTQHESVQA